MSGKTLVERLDRRGGLVEALRPVSWLFGALSGLRGWLYGRGLLRSFAADVPVICVGNIVAGGTGKTPMVVLLAKQLQAAGFTPGILSRGYGKAGTSGMDSDEARLYGQLLEDLPRFATPDRVAGARRLVELGADLILMDDGFQHRRLRRDLDLVLVDGLAPYGLAKGPRAFLPRGLLRESPVALRRAGAVVITRSDLVEPERLAELELELEAWAPGVPRLLARHAPVGLRRLTEGGAGLGLADLDGREVDVVSAIGNPAAFEATLAGLGARLGQRRRFTDHHEYEPGDLAGLGTGGRIVVTTAKDAVKLGGVLETGDWGGNSGLGGVYALDVAMGIERGQAVLDALLGARLGRPDRGELNK